MDPEFFCDRDVTFQIEFQSALSLRFHATVLLGKGEWVLACDRHVDEQGYLHDTHAWYSYWAGIVRDPCQFSSEALEKDLEWCQEIFGACIEFMQEKENTGI